MSYIIHDGTFLNLNDPVFTAENRGFNYGDSLFETMHLCRNTLMFWDDHYNRMISGLKLFSLDLPKSVSKTSLHKEILELASKNKGSKSSRVKLNVYRKGGGRYSPESNDASYLIRTYSRKRVGFDDFRDNLKISIFDELKKEVHPISNYKTGSSLIYILAGIFTTQGGFDDCLILNQNGCIVDGLYSSVFLCKDGVVYTSNVEQGCIDGIMRKQVIKLCRENDITIVEKPVYPQDALVADEVFFTNATEGVKAAASLGDKKFNSVMSRTIYNKMYATFPV